MHMNLDHVASGHFLGRDVHCEFDYWPLAVSTPPTKVCPQCKAAVPVRWKTYERCDHMSFDPNKKLSVICEKHMRAIESDSVKSDRKAKDKLHMAYESASEICERTLHWQAHGKHERVTRQ